jgi:hypothetical protein
MSSFFHLAALYCTSAGNPERRRRERELFRKSVQMRASWKSAGIEEGANERIKRSGPRT